MLPADCAAEETRHEPDGDRGSRVREHGGCRRFERAAVEALKGQHWNCNAAMILPGQEGSFNKFAPSSGGAVKVNLSPGAEAVRVQQREWWMHR